MIYFISAPVSLMKGIDWNEGIAYNDYESALCRQDVQLLFNRETADAITLALKSHQ